MIFRRRRIRVEMEQQTVRIVVPASEPPGGYTPPAPGNANSGGMASTPDLTAERRPKALPPTEPSHMDSTELPETKR